MTANYALTGVLNPHLNLFKLHSNLRGFTTFAAMDTNHRFLTENAFVTINRDNPSPKRQTSTPLQPQQTVHSGE